MQTRFTEEQLADPDVSLADEILRKCVHCGFCLATCPTYVLEGDERDSPRGRIYLIKEYLETGEGAKETLIHLDRCLTCGSCETTCPSGVEYLHLSDIGRTRLVAERTRGAGASLLRKGLVTLLTRQKLFRSGILLGRLTRPVHGLLPHQMKAMVAMLPDTRPITRPGLAAELHGTPGMRVALHTGCVQRDLKPQINEATVRVLTKLGCEVVIPDGFGCCGALADHLGEKGRARAQATRNIDAIMGAGGEAGFDAIVSNASGCGIALKDYGHLFRNDEDVTKGARKVASLALDLSQVLEKLIPQDPLPPNGTRVAWQSSCTLQHGQKIPETPKAILRHFGYEVLEPAEPHLCCGSAGTYSILEPKRSQALQTRKVAALEALEPDVIASANIGCMTGLSRALKVPVLHVIELIDQAMA